MFLIFAGVVILFFTGVLYVDQDILRIEKLLKARKGTDKIICSVRENDKFSNELKSRLIDCIMNKHMQSEKILEMNFGKSKEVIFEYVAFFKVCFFFGGGLIIIGLLSVIRG